MKNIHKSLTSKSLKKLKINGINYYLENYLGNQGSSVLA
jgi:hypothetical protein